ncbi:unnamed protein product, partial [Coregonus sp. 'balchen']
VFNPANLIALSSSAGQDCGCSPAAEATAGCRRGLQTVPLSHGRGRPKTAYDRLPAPSRHGGLWYGGG